MTSKKADEQNSALNLPPAAWPARTAKPDRCRERFPRALRPGCRFRGACAPGVPLPIPCGRACPWGVWCPCDRDLSWRPPFHVPDESAGHRVNARVAADALRSPRLDGAPAELEV